jgi:arabinose-5-phosphate isomerase
MLRDLFQEQQRYLDFFFKTVSIDEAEAVFDVCLKTKGLIALTGVGKSGIIGEKIAMTLISTGTRALYLPTTNLLHGDIGVLTSEDVVILLSKSGETEELLNVLPHIQRRGAKTIALVSNPHSRLAQLADLKMILPVEKELCPFDLAPTTSTEVQLLFGDVLSIALMKAKGFDLERYGENHPLGAIGKKITLKVDDLMQLELPICLPHQKLGDLLNDLSSKKCGCLIIVNEEQEFQGIFTDGDLRRSLQSLGSAVLEKRIDELMTRSALSIQKGERAMNAVKLMQKDPSKWIMVLPVLEQQKVVGLIRMHDIIHSGLSS